MFNKVILLGYLGGDPEIRYTQNGVAVSNISIATTDFWKNKDGAENKDTDWHKCTIWGRLAEVAAEYLGKGDLVLIEGKQKASSYDKGGTTIYYNYVHVTSMKFVKVKGSKAIPSDLDLPLGDKGADPDDVPF